MKLPNLTGKALIDWLVANKADLIEAKKATIKMADAITFQPVLEKEYAVKGKYLYEDDLEKGVIKRTVIANTYLYMDSHKDVHLENTFTNSIAQRVNRPAPHLHDHEFSVLSKVGKALNYSEREISWRELGLGKTGKTIALFLETEVKKSYNEKVFDAYLDGAIDQHSVGMRYIKVALAVNDEESYPNEYKVWQEHIAKIGNRTEVEKQGYFFAVSEAALLETSAVLEGSNGLTPTLGNKSQQPSNDIDEVEIVEPHKALDINGVLENYLTN